MLCSIPENWTYGKSLEMLYLFYQKTDELLSTSTSDTYSLPRHNSLTLVREIADVLELLNRYDMLDDYYIRYIPPIIEEFLNQVEDDYILKRILGKRLFSIRAGFSEALKDYIHLRSWIDIFYQTCTFTKYLSTYRDEIIRLVTQTSDKTKLLYCISNYYVCLVNVGYSREYLYITGKRFFTSSTRKIENSGQIKDFFDLFTCHSKRFDFLILMNIDSIEYMDSISDNLTLSEHISKIDVNKERKELCKDYIVEDIIKEYDRKISQAKPHVKMAIVRFYDDALDPYSAASRFYDYIRFLQTFVRYFKHFYFSKQVYRILYKADNGYYTEIKLSGKMMKRPYIKQDIIDLRIGNILNAKYMGIDAFNSITHAIEMHSEAFDSSRNTATLLKSFWTALETLFSNPVPNSPRDNVINSVLPIIQKTYILKILRTIYTQLRDAIDFHELERIGVADFASFVKYFASFEEDSTEMKKIYNCLSDNPLLRSRLFMARRTLSSGKSIMQFLEAHRIRVEWQLKRIYRIRNITTHLGAEVEGIDIVVNHLHSYFDLVVNYMLCKSENGDAVMSTSAVVVEAKNDNRIYAELLKDDQPLSENNYINYLFGADTNLINYEFD